MKLLYTHLLLLVCWVASFAQPVQLQTVKSERIRFKTEKLGFVDSIKRVSPAVISEIEYSMLFWITENFLYKDDTLKGLLKALFLGLDKRSIAFQRSFLQDIYTLYQRDFVEEILDFAEVTTDPKLFAMSAEYLLLNHFTIDDIQDRFPGKFSTWNTSPIIHMLIQKNRTGYRENQPDLPSLLSTEKFKGFPVVYSFQRVNRNFPGLAIVRDTNGVFVKNAESHLFSVPQLARSITDLPGYLTNGNTPEGIFSIIGFDTSKNQFIGPTPNIQTVLPFESETSVFFHDSMQSQTPMNLEKYLELLPRDWQSYKPVQEAFWAGKAGRSEIIIHGTTIDPEIYKNEPYYPNTPSLGCLCAFEKWSEETGALEYSNQKLLYDALVKTGKMSGFLIVINVNSDDLPVTMGEIEKYIK